MDLLTAILLLFLVIGLAQIAFAGRAVDLIHGGAGRRTPHGRSMDRLVLRLAGGFVAVLAGAMLAVLGLVRPG